VLHLVAQVSASSSCCCDYPPPVCGPESGHIGQGHIGQGHIVRDTLVRDTSSGTHRQGHIGQGRIVQESSVIGHGFVCSKVYRISRTNINSNCQRSTLETILLLTILTHINRLL
jgi:hypothetical protein